jgi:hypothetical protein
VMEMSMQQLSIPAHSASALSLLIGHTVSHDSIPRQITTDEQRESTSSSTNISPPVQSPISWKEWVRLNDGGVGV